MIDRLVTTATMAALALSVLFISVWIVGGLLVALTSR
jgi:hypothetical protein